MKIKMQALSFVLIGVGILGLLTDIRNHRMKIKESMMLYLWQIFSI